MKHEIFGVCKHSKLIYSTNYIDPFLINIITATINIGCDFIDSVLESIDILSYEKVFIKIEEDYVFFGNASIDTYIEEFKKMNI